MIGVGIHDISLEAYLADPCEQPSLTRSGIVTLERSTPAKFAARHPRLTQFPEALKQKATDPQKLGSVVHAKLCGTGADYVAKDCSEFKTQDGKPAKVWSGDGKTWKQQQEAAGKIVISREGDAKALRVATEIYNTIASEFAMPDWRDHARLEQTLIWQRETSYGPIWCRAKPDIMLPFAILDAKSTGLTLDHETIRRRLEATGDDVQGVWYPQGAHAIATGCLRCGHNTFHRTISPKGCETSGCGCIDPEFVDDRVETLPFFFVIAEFEPPYTVILREMDEEWKARRQRHVDRACELFAKCLYANEWPEYTEKMPRRATLSAPSYKVSQWLEEELAEVGDVEAE